MDNTDNSKKPTKGILKTANSLTRLGTKLRFSNVVDDVPIQESSEEAESRHLQFEEKRKKHYAEYKAIKLGRQLVKDEMGEDFNNIVDCSTGSQKPGSFNVSEDANSEKDVNANLKLAIEDDDD